MASKDNTNTFNPALYNPFLGMTREQLRNRLDAAKDGLEGARKASSEAGRVQRNHEREIAQINEALAVEALGETTPAEAGQEARGNRQRHTPPNQA